MYVHVHIVQRVEIIRFLTASVYAYNQTLNGHTLPELIHQGPPSFSYGAMRLEVHVNEKRIYFVIMVGSELFIRRLVYWKTANN